MPFSFVNDTVNNTFSVSQDFVFSGPATGDPNIVTTITFGGTPYIEPPNILLTTGNPHWTAHAIWVNTAGFGLVINRKTPPPATQTFTLFVHMMGNYADAAALSEAPSMQREDIPVEEFWRLAEEYGPK